MGPPAGSMPICSGKFAKSITATMVVATALLVLLPAHTAEQTACRTDACAANIGYLKTTSESGPRWRTCPPAGHTGKLGRDPLRYDLRRSDSRWQYARPRGNLKPCSIPLFELTLGLRGGSHVHDTSKKPESTTTTIRKEQARRDDDDDHAAGGVHQRIASEGTRGLAQADSLAALSTLPDGWIQLFDHQTERPCVLMYVCMHACMHVSMYV
jgi:hypothetical protein